MTIEFMRDLLSKDEKITVEYKTCQHGVQEDVYETVCSFSNRYGGYIIMGAEDDGTPIGINRNMVKDMKKNFVNQLNNPDKMSPTLYLSLEELEYEGVLLLWVYVPPTSTVEKCVNRIYDRNEDGDMDITDSPIQLQNMYNRKSNTYAEHKIFPYVTTEDLRMDLMDKVRNLAKSKNPDHPWLKMSDEEILKSAGLWEKDFSSGIQGYNLAGVLLFGQDEVIGSGVRNLYKYTPIYSNGGKSELIEDDVFRITIPLDKVTADEGREQKTLSEREQKIYNMIRENLHLSVE